MQRTNLSGLCTKIRTLKLCGLAISISPSSCGNFLHVPSLDTLKLLEMDISYKTVQRFGTLSVTRLHFVNCYASQFALHKAIRACVALKTFTYSLGATHWEQGKEYNVAQLLHALSSRHVDTPQHLIIRTLGARVNNKGCQYLEELVEFRKLQTLSLDYYLLHVDHLYRTNKQYARTYQKQYNFFTSTNASPPEPSDILLALANSLYRLELHNCDKIPVSSLILNLMESKRKERLPSLRAIKVTSERLPTSASTWMSEPST